MVVLLRNYWQLRQLELLLNHKKNRPTSLFAASVIAPTTAHRTPWRTSAQTTPAQSRHAAGDYSKAQPTHQLTNSPTRQNARNEKSVAGILDSNDAFMNLRQAPRKPAVDLRTRRLLLRLIWSTGLPRCRTGWDHWSVCRLTGCRNRCFR